MGCDAIFFLDSDLFSLNKQQKYQEIIKRIGHPIPNIQLVSWPTIGEQIKNTGFYSFNYQDDDIYLAIFYIDTEETTIYEFIFEDNFIEFDCYDYTNHGSGNLFYVDRWYTFLKYYLGSDKYEGIVNQVNKIKKILDDIIFLIFHCTFLLVMGDQVYIHERIRDLLYEDKSIQEVLNLFPQLKYFDNENVLEYNKTDDDVLTFLYKIKQE